jgi:hypothetical protein
MKSKKEETKLLLSKTLIMLESQLGEMEQDNWNEHLNERERKGLRIEMKECVQEINNVKECFHWVNGLK